MKILYATDGEAPARAAASVITKMFDPGKVTVDVLVVSLPPAYDLWSRDEEIPWESLDIPVPSAHALALDAAEGLEAYGFEATPRTAEGNAAREILRIAEMEPFDVIALGGGHTTWLGNVLLGSVSLHVLHHSPRSVLIAHHTVHGEPHLLVATDGSPGASFGVDLVGKLCDPGCAAEIATVVSPQYTPVVYPHYGVGYGLAVDQIAEVRKDIVERGRGTLTGAAETLRAQGFDPVTCVLEGAPSVQLLKEAENIAADMVVVGARGRGALRRVALGSVTDRIVRHAAATLVARGSSSTKASTGPDAVARP